MFLTPCIRPGGLGPKTMDFLTSVANTGAATTAAFNNSTLGPEYGERAIIATFGHWTSGSTRDVSSATIDGQAMTKVISSGSDFAACGIFIKAWPTGATANLIVTFSGSVGEAAMGTFSMHGGYVSVTATVSNGETSGSASIVVPTTGSMLVGCGASVNFGGSTSHTWTNLTEKFERQMPGDGSALSGGFTLDIASGARTVSFSNGGDGTGISIATWF